MRDDRRDNHASHIYMKDDTSMCDPMEASYVQRYHGGYHDQNSINSKNDKGDVADIEEEEIKPILTMPNPKPIKPNSPTVSPFLKDCIVHISYTNAKTFTNNVLLNQFGDKELKLTLGVGTSRTTKKEIKKDNVGLPKQTNKEWKLN
ncbi:hypothetical protein Tco_0355466 [Tanacetum coccineum]